MYGEDYDANIVDGDVGDRLDPGYQTFRIGQTSVRVLCWVSRPMGPNGEDYNKTLEDKVRGLRVGGLWRYLEDYKVYNCPIDKRYVKMALYKQTNTLNTDPDWYGGYRSYSIGKVLSKRPSGSGEDPFTVSKLSEFSNPGSKIVFLEEADGMGWNDRTWNMNMDITVKRWGDPFAIWHNGSSTFAFADGHAERHKWVDKGTLKMSRDQEKNQPATIDGDPSSPISQDYIWFRRAYIPGK